MNQAPEKAMDLHSHISRACKKIAPLWPLSHFVAVNPFLGYADQSFAKTATAFKRIQDADTVLPREWFKAHYEAGKISLKDLQAGIANASPEVLQSFKSFEATLTVDHLVDRLNTPHVDQAEHYQTCSFSVYLDSRLGTPWQYVIREEAAKWCAAYDDEGQSSWKFPWKNLSLYAGWKEAALIDRNPELNGLKGFRAKVKSFSDDPEVAIEEAVSKLSMPEEKIEEFLYRILLTLPGWSGHLRYKDREHEIRNSEGDLVVQLLAILLNYEVALYELHLGESECIEGWKRNLEVQPEDLSDDAIPLALAERLIWQSALENAFEQTLRTQITAEAKSNERPDVQAVFCIDVRSEVFRRALESTKLNIQTIGFAGFFGLPIDHSIPGIGGSQARCPVLLAPPVKTAEGLSGIEAVQYDELRFERVIERENERSWKRFKEAAASCFTFVETIGLSYAYKIICDAFAIDKSKHKSASAPAFLEAMPTAARADMAMGILNGLGLKENFAKIVLFCGHGSQTKNNPFASGLDCGACGGHAGDANARLAAALLNQQDVRSELQARGIEIPKDTTFIGGLHNTTTDQVTLYETDPVDASLIGELQESLETAGGITALERSVLLGNAKDQSDIVEAVRSRSLDWSQVRPEWGLAGNAAFIVAPREWTRASNLGSRAFLHEYNATADPEAAVLEAVIGGPLVVGSWINLQYYGSATDNHHFGSGHKAIHNVVGGVGVALGNENDLRPGLPFQSVHDGEKLIHEPLRLHACIAADTEVLDSILSRQEHVRHLVENGWIHLISLGANGQQWLRRMPNGEWRAQA
ncbi:MULTISPECIES: YbcC family protein [unclassified Lentimonas]|uniref:YbcC family protein n=1 Tax=unclassified Lentimonas TaxID=2630993 RepID=UPI0013242ABB|nr:MULTISPECIES: DUF2309 domain-containing protein [unclassified Lentimonas]CAA6676698.1 Hypothetical transmembrane protein coupled to NADH-ubiquinone oxidoreductase chain 5 homolog [Lentimonas sp. CC4]CAA6684638.1 Hypothetical transmembrane protein coupled to NADH-ubiquinone oxidoreductase chain 5 homolog [Lentimonas sp. CC6]CAA7075273.1 Hypothetical transmembrane protein coupled to NADH-ubiquinone oxidoreductase chain 5 homolog [Lentimonas sp. CC4]CAA7170659.1 Hypothetical transmembrane prote